jgi:hypothetical protein
MRGLAGYALLRCGVLEASFCARPCLRDLPFASLTYEVLRPLWLQTKNKPQICI